VALATAGAALAAGQASAAQAGDLAFGPVLPALNRLIVSFDDHPTPAQARQRLAGLGRVRAVVPEIGIWSLQPRRPLSARRLALARAQVDSAQWSLEQSQDASADPKATPPPAVAPGPFNDPYFIADDQWGLFTPYWSPSLTGYAPRPRIAILDGGVDDGHEEWGGPSSPLVDPHSTYRNDDNASDWGRTGHGTHVAGIAAAPANNGVGVVGVAPAAAGVAEVVPVQIADREGRSTDETMMKGIRWAVLHEARVINISAGGPGYSRAFQRTVDWAYARGSLIVASVGNEGESENEVNFPAGYKHVLGVGAQCSAKVDPPDCPTPFGVADFSNHNGSVDLVAPGVNVLSTVPKRVKDRELTPGYALKDGTSMAAPYVAGAAALAFASHPGATPYQVMRQLENTATDLGQPGRDDAAGYGGVNPAAAVLEPVPPDDPAEINDDVSMVDGQGLKEAEGDAVTQARVDRWDDPSDVYPVRLRRGDHVQVSLTYRRGLLHLYVWKPGTVTVLTHDKAIRNRRILSRSTRPGRSQALAFEAPITGRYFVHVYAKRGGTPYTLTVTKGGTRLVDEAARGR
jgi:hypothetical protein